MKRRTRNRKTNRKKNRDKGNTNESINNKEQERKGKKKERKQIKRFNKSTSTFSQDKSKHIGNTHIHQPSAKTPGQEVQSITQVDAQRTPTLGIEYTETSTRHGENINSNRFMKTKEM